MLRGWVADLFCPQFMISNENLFSGKVTADNRDLLLSILNEMIDSDGGVLLRVAIDDLGQKLQANINTEPSLVPITNSLASVKLVGCIEHNFHRRIDDLVSLYVVDQNKNGNHLSVIHTVYQDVCKLQGMLQGSEKHERRAIQLYITSLSCWLGSLQASYSLAHNNEVPREAIQRIRTAATRDVSSMLKLATVFYCSREFDEAQTKLQKVEDIFCRKDMQATCGCYAHRVNRHPECLIMMYKLEDEEERAALVAHCVTFSPHEIHCTPPALGHELYRAVGDDVEHRDPYQKRWMRLAGVECLPYLYFLQYLTYKQLGKHELQKRSLQNLERCTREDEYLSHRETAWNLLGQCWESEQKPETAMTCYRTSLEIRPRNNAANWHVAILWYKMIKNPGLTTECQ